MRVKALFLELADSLHVFGGKLQNSQIEAEENCVVLYFLRAFESDDNSKVESHFIFLDF